MVIRAWEEGVYHLTQEQATALEREGVADVLVGQASGTWRVRAGSKIGVVIGDGWELRIMPRLPIPKLMFLLGYASDPRGWRRLVAGFEEETDLFAAIASGFSWHATWAIDRALLRGYIHREDRLHAPRGRVRFADQLARAGGLPMPVEVSFDEFTEDVLENQMLKTASMLLLRLHRVPVEARKRLLRIRSVLENVEPLLAWRGVRAPTITRLNERYAPALRLAELVFAGASVTERTGDVRSTTFVFDMNVVFEEFVTTAFRESMRRHGGTVRDQVQTHSLDEAGRLKLRPDLSWWAGSRCLAVLDAKYKAIDYGLMRHDDAYQMLAYCSAYGLTRGYLVYAKDSGATSRTHVVRNLGTELIVTALDVGLEPDDLLAEVDRLADRVASDLSADRLPGAMVA